MGYNPQESLENTVNTMCFGFKMSIFHKKNTKSLSHCTLRLWGPFTRVLEANPFFLILTISSWWLNHPFEKYARQIGSFPQVGGKIKNIWNHHLDLLCDF